MCVCVCGDNLCFALMFMDLIELLVQWACCLVRHFIRYEANDRRALYTNVAIIHI